MSAGSSALLVLTNTQSPYNSHFYADLSTHGTLDVYYAFEPAHAGRAWQLPQRPWEHIGAPWRTEIAAMAQYRGANLLLSGDYTSPRSIMRLTASRVVRSRYFWGERLRSGRTAKVVVRKLLLSGFDGVFAVGSRAGASYREVVGPGIPVHVLPYVCTDRGVPRRPSQDPVIGFVGSLIPRKGLDILLRSLARVDHPPRLEVAGSGPEEDSLRALARQLRLTVSWLGELPTDAVNQARARWWLQAVPSRYDGWGVVVNESLASGVPVLASIQTGAAHDLLDGACGDIVASEEVWPEMLTKWLAIGHDQAVTAAARRVAISLSSQNAARWLLDVMANPGDGERHFVTEMLQAAPAAMGREPSLQE